jgi:hypothetical protein
LVLEAGERELRLLACACLRRVWHLLPEGPSRESAEVGEAWADGRATRQELDAAFDAAVDSEVGPAGDPALSQATAEAAQGVAGAFPDYGGERAPSSSLWEAYRADRVWTRRPMVVVYNAC